MLLRHLAAIGLVTAIGTLAYALLHALAYVTGNLDAEGGSLFHPLAPPLGRLLKLLGVDADLPLRSHREFR